MSAFTPDYFEDFADGWFYQITQVHLTPSYWLNTGNTYSAVRDKQQQDLYLINDNASDKDVSMVFYLTTSNDQYGDGNIEYTTVSVWDGTASWSDGALPLLADDHGKYWSNLASEFTQDKETLPNISVQGLRLHCDNEDEDTTINAWQSRPKVSEEHDQAYTGELSNFIQYAERYTVSSQMFKARRPASSWMMMGMADTMNTLAYHGTNALATTVMIYSHYSPA